MITQPKTMTPQKVINVLEKQGIVISIQEATDILKFMLLIAEIHLNNWQEI